MPPVQILLHLPPSPPLSPQPTPTTHSSPNLTRLLRLLRARCYGRVISSADWTSCPLSGDEYACLERAVAEVPARFPGWFREKARFDFDATAPRRRSHREGATGDREGAIEEEAGARDAGVYTLRMPSRRHEHFIANVVHELQRQIEHEPELAGVHYSGSPTLSLHPPRLENSSQESGPAADAVVKRSPDATFFPPNRTGEGDLPTVVVEVGYSQQLNDLPKLAESYIVDSRHAIRCVVGIDIPYPQRKRRGAPSGAGASGDRAATVSVWRAATIVEDGEEVGICRCHVDAVPFQTSSDGTPRPGSLDLHTSDFIPSAESAAGETTLSIPFATLASFLLPLASDPTDPAPSTAKTEAEPMKFRKRKRSPSEQLAEDREADFLRRERDESDREQAIDGAYRSGSGSRGREARRRATAAAWEQDVTVEGGRRRRRRRSARVSASRKGSGG